MIKKRITFPLLLVFLLTNLFLTGSFTGLTGRSYADEPVVSLQENSVPAGDTVVAVVCSPERPDSDFDIWLGTDAAPDDDYISPGGTSFHASRATDQDGRASMEIDIPDDAEEGNYVVGVLFEGDETGNYASLTVTEAAQVQTPASIAVTSPADTINTLDRTRNGEELQLAAAIIDTEGNPINATEGVRWYYKTASGSGGLDSGREVEIAASAGTSLTFGPTDTDDNWMFKLGFIKIFAEYESNGVEVTSPGVRRPVSVFKSVTADKDSVAQGGTLDITAVTMAKYAGQALEFTLYDSSGTKVKDSSNNDIKVSGTLAEDGDTARAEMSLAVPADLPTGNYYFKSFMDREIDFTVTEAGAVQTPASIAVTSPADTINTLDRTRNGEELQLAAAIIDTEGNPINATEGVRWYYKTASGSGGLDSGREVEIAASAGTSLTFGPTDIDAEWQSKVGFIKIYAEYTANGMTVDSTGVTRPISVFKSVTASPESVDQGQGQSLQVEAAAPAIYAGQTVELTLKQGDTAIVDGSGQEIKISGALVEEGEEARVTMEFTVPADLPAGLYDFAAEIAEVSFTVTGGGTGQSLWPQKHFDPQNTGQSAASGPAGDNLGYRWGYYSLDEEYSTYEEGLLILPDGRMWRQAVNRSDGSISAEITDTSGNAEINPAYASIIEPLLLGDYYYGAVSADAAGKEKIVRVDCGDDTVLKSVCEYDVYENYIYQKSSGSYIYNSSQLTGDENGLYFVTRLADTGECHGLVALDPELNEKWSFPLPENYWVISKPAVGPDGTVYLLAFDKGGGTAGLYAVDAAGALKWQYEVSGLIINKNNSSFWPKQPVIAGPDGTIYFLVNQGVQWRLCAVLDGGDTAASKWTKDLDPQEVYKMQGYAVSSDDTVYVLAKVQAGRFSRLLSIDPASGNTNWTYSQTADEPCGGPVIDRDGVIYYAERGELAVHAVNPDGSRNWMYKFDNPVIAQPPSQVFLAPANDSLLVDRQSCYLCIDNSGRQLSLELDYVDKEYYNGRYLSYGDVPVTVRVKIMDNGQRVTSGVNWSYSHGDGVVAFKDRADEITFTLPQVTGVSPIWFTLTTDYDGRYLNTDFRLQPNRAVLQTPQTDRLSYQSGETVSATVDVTGAHGESVSSGITWFYTDELVDFSEVPDIDEIQRTVVASAASDSIDFTVTNDQEDAKEIYLYAEYDGQYSEGLVLTIAGYGSPAGPSITEISYDTVTGMARIKGEVAERNLILKTTLAREGVDPVIREFELGNDLQFDLGISGLAEGTYTVSVQVRRNMAGSQYTDPVVCPQQLVVPAGGNEELIEAAFNRTVDYYKGMVESREGRLGDWEALGLGWAGEDLRSGEWLVEGKGFAYWRARSLLANDWVYGARGEKTTDLERTILGIVGAGYNPRDFCGMNLVSDLVEAINVEGGNISTKWAGAKRDDYAGNAQIWGLNALILAEAGEADGFTDELKTKVVQCLLQNQGTDGSFTWGESVGEGHGDIDSTGMALCGLGAVRDVPGVDDAIGRAVNYLESNQKDHGGFEGWGIVGYPNTESSAWVIQGLVACGLDPLAPEWEKANGSLLTAFLGAQMPDGGFSHTVEPGQKATNGMTTEQSLLALTDLYRGESKYTNLWSPNLPSYSINQPLITDVKLSPSSILRGSEKTVAVEVSTYLVDDGTVVNVDVVTEAGSVVSQVAAQTATLQNGKAAVELTVPADIAAGTYKVRVSCGELLSYGVLIVTSGSSGGSGTSQSVSAYIRVEGYNGTIVSRKSVSTDNFDLTPYLGEASGGSAQPSSGWGPDKLPKPTVAHALIKALESEGIDCFNHYSGLDMQDYGWSLYVAMIAGEREFDHRSTSGWMYRVNGSMPGYGCQVYTLTGGEDIVWYFGVYGFDTWYSELTASKNSAKTGEEVTLTLTGVKTDLSGSSGVGPTTSKKLKDATIYVNGAEYRPEGSAIVTDENGQAVIKFNDPGTYEVSAERFTGEEYRDIVRPLPVKITVSGPSISGSVSVKTSLAPKVEASNGVASVAISASDMTDAIKDAKENNSAYIVIAPEITGEVKKVSVELLKSSLSAVATETDADLTVETPVGSLTIPSSVLASIASQAAGGTVTMSLEAVDNSALSPAQQEAVGDKPVYDITIMSGVSSISSFGGGSLTISLPYTPREGENLSDIAVWRLNDDGQLQQVACTYDPDTGTVTFTTDHLSCYVVGCAMPAAFRTGSSFTDVKPDDWFYDSVAFAVQNGLFSGTSATTFSPNEAMTRAMLVTVLYRLEGEPSVTGANSFTDVKSGEWYTDAVLWANASGIVTGYGGGLFGANDSITREQMAAILYRYAQYKGYDVKATADLASYTDATDVSGWAQAAMKWANAGGLIVGTTQTTLDPTGTAKRAQVASIIMRFVEGFAK